MIDRQKVYADLVNDEGVKLNAYIDTLGFLTIGVGHKVLKEDNIKLGDEITESYCESLFNKDLDTAIEQGKKYIKDFESLVDVVQEVLVNMIFNMGIGGVLKFKKFLAALSVKDYKLAANEMENSLWFKQVGMRAKRLQKQILSLV
jgi:lysozyme